MGNVTEAVREALEALIELIEVERYQENARAAELVKSSDVACAADETAAEYEARMTAFARVREIEADHGYRLGWNMRSRILTRRLEAIVTLLDTGKPAHASGAV